MKKAILAMLALVALAGCSSTEPQPSADLTGVWTSEVREEDDRASMTMTIEHEAKSGDITGEIEVVISDPERGTIIEDGPVTGTLREDMTVNMRFMILDARGGLQFLGEVKNEDEIAGTILHPDGDDHLRTTFTRLNEEG